MSETYLIMMEGHEGVARVDPKILGSVEAESWQDALVKFADSHQEVRREGGKYYDARLPLRLFAFVKPDPDVIRPIAYELWEQDRGSVNDPGYYWGLAEAVFGFYQAQG